MLIIHFKEIPIGEYYYGFKSISVGMCFFNTGSRFLILSFALRVLAFSRSFSMIRSNSSILGDGMLSVEVKERNDN